jgi:hypothetical protein
MKKPNQEELLSNLNFKTAFGATMGYHLANTLATFLGIFTIGAVITIGVALYKMF